MFVCGHGLFGRQGFFSRLVRVSGPWPCAVALMVASGAVAQADEPAGAVPRVQIIGDSIFAWNRERGEDVAAQLAGMINAEITDNAMSGAQIFVDDEDAAARGLDIPTQFDAGDWDWVIMNGGANDLEEDCGCNACDVILDDLISADSGAGRIPELVRRMRSGGARVIFLGYYQVGIEDTYSAACVDEFDALDARVSALAAAQEGVYFRSGLDLLSVGDLDRDGIHPNAVGSEILAMALAEVIGAAD